MNCHTLKNSVAHQLDSIKGFMPAAGYEQRKETVEEVVSCKGSTCRGDGQLPRVGTGDEFYTRRIRRSQRITIALLVAIAVLLVLLYFKK